MQEANRGRCKLCGQNEELQDSHLLPKSIYKLLSASDYANPNPVLIRPGTAVQTSRQTKSHLLCSACEQLLSRAGERRIVPLLAKRDLSSPLHELITKLPPDINADGFLVYAAARNPDFPCDALAHFAMAIFWKASIHSWHCADGEPLIQLGPYQEMVRAYVHAPSINVFPKNMALLITVLPPPKIPLLMGIPVEGPRGDGYRNFRFYIPGIQFILSIGKTVSTEVCFVSNPLRPVSVHDIEEKVNAIPSRMYLHGKRLAQSPGGTWGAITKKR